MALHNIKIAVDAPVPSSSTGAYRPNVMSVNLESELPLAVIQKHVNDLFSALTAAAIAPAPGDELVARRARPSGV